MAFIYGTGGADVLNGTAEEDFIQGYGGDDTINGGAGPDMIFGNDGNDVLSGGPGDDIIYGGPGTLDLLSYQAVAAAISVDLRTGQATTLDGTDVFFGIEGILGTAFADTLTGDSGDNFLRGNTGNDTLDGGEGSDTADYRQAAGAVFVNLGAQGGPQVSGADGVDTLISIENVRGSLQYDDVLTGSSGDNVIMGRGGNDTLDGAGGFDTVDYSAANGAVQVDLAAGTGLGADGSDQLSGFEAIIGSSFADTLIGSAGPNRISGLGGNDTLEGGGGNDTLDGGAGTDTVSYVAAGGAVTVNLAMGTATGAAGNDTLISIEIARGSNFDDLLTGNAGSNYLAGWGGNDTLDGGDGIDYAAYGDLDNLGLGGVTVDLAAGTASSPSGNDTLINIEGVAGSNNADSILGSDGDDYIEGRGGIDTLVGGAGFDTLMYLLAPGAVTVNLATGAVTGAAGADVISGFEAITGSPFGDTLTGDAGDNRIDGRGGDDTIDGGAGFDFAVYQVAPSGVTVNLSAGTATGGDGNDTLSNFEGVIGTFGADTLIGNGAANWLIGNPGDDVLNGRGGDDTLDGGDGTDFASYADAAGPVTVDLAAGTVSGPDGSDTLVSIEGVFGSALADRITGDANLNFLRGNAGNDTLDGGGGIDYADYRSAAGGVTVDLAAGTATGADGNDTLINIENVRGSDFGDRLIGDAKSNLFRPMNGFDTIEGGRGDDTVDYRQNIGSVGVNLAEGDAFKGGSGTLEIRDLLDSIEFVFGSPWDDLIVGSVYTNVIRGLGGDDTIDGGLGADIVDYVEATGPIDVDLRNGYAITSEGRDTLSSIEGIYGTAFDDRLTGDAANNIFRGRGGSDTIDGGDGLDIVDYIESTAGIVVNLASGERSGQVTEDVLTSIEGFFGTNFADRLIGDDGDNLFRGNGGVDTLDGGAGIDSVDYRQSSGSVTVDLATNTVIDVDGNDVISNFENVGGSFFDDRLTGDAGTNVLRGRAGNDTIDGAAGIDTARYDGLREWFQVTLANGMPAVVTDANEEEGVDTLTAIERLQFGDISLAFDITPTGNVLDPVTKGEGGNAGKAYRLYQAAFDRTPDEGGVGYWLAQIDAGAKLFDIATGFLESAEFKALYGENPGNQEYTQALYRNVLDRDPDQAGYDYWNEVLESGATTRQQMLVDFSESAENKANVLPAIENGVRYDLWID